MHEAAADFTVRWRDKGEMSRDEAAATLKQGRQVRRHQPLGNTGPPQHQPVATDDEILLNHADPYSSKEILAALGCIDHEYLIYQLPQLLTEQQRQIIVAIDIEGLSRHRAATQFGSSVRSLQTPATPPWTDFGAT